MAAERLKSVLNHVIPSSPVGKVLSKNSDDVVITFATRTAMTKGGKGALKDTGIDMIAYNILKQIKEKSGIDPASVKDICMGNVREAQAAYALRAAALAAGFPASVAAHSTNRFCSSGLQSILTVANNILTGTIDVGIALGVESMSAAGPRGDPTFHPTIMNSSQDAADCQQPMLQTSENVSNDFNVTREKQDRYAAESSRRAEVAQKSGWFDDEIFPMTTTVKDPKTGEEKEVTFSRDEGIRYGTTYEGLSKVRPAAPQFGDHSTGGNSSQVTDGGAGVVLMKRSTAQSLGLPILAKFCGATMVGLPPRIMGIGPSIAIPKLLERFNLKNDDIDVFEINEAFASMAVYCLETLGIDHGKMNPRGGAIALGHPLGCTGTRQVVTGLSELRRTKKQVLITSMCVGTGQGMAGLFVNEVL